MKVTVYVASLKDFAFPKDELYVPIQVGKCFTKDQFTEICDNTGDNISEKNKTYCELTALYWMWKNDRTSDYLGLCHYRRYFAGKRFGKKRNRILTQAKVEEIFRKNPDAIVVPKKRNYFFDTLYSHYANTHDATHLEIARQVIGEISPDYLDAFDQTMNRRTAYMFNMFIMRREYVELYCQWLFPILERMEERIDTRKMSAFDARLFSRVSELLLNVWVNRNGYQTMEGGYVNLTRTKWIGKIRAYIMAKFFGKKLDRSY